MTIKLGYRTADEISNKHNAWRRSSRPKNASVILFLIYRYCRLLSAPLDML